MPFVIKTVAAAATAAVVSTAPEIQQTGYEQQCFLVPTTHVYITGVYQTTEVECYLVQVPVRSK